MLDSEEEKDFDKEKVLDADDDERESASHFVLFRALGWLLPLLHYGAAAPYVSSSVTGLASVACRPLLQQGEEFLLANFHNFNS